MKVIKKNFKERVLDAVGLAFVVRLSCSFFWALAQVLFSVLALSFWAFCVVPDEGVGPVRYFYTYACICIRMVIACIFRVILT